jgi:transposase
VQVAEVVETELGDEAQAGLGAFVPGRSGAAYAAWLQARNEAFRDGIKIATLDPFHGYKNAIDDQLEDAVAVLDAFHIVKLGTAAVDEVRRRVQQETLGHRGRKGDPLYGIRMIRTRQPSACARRVASTSTSGGQFAWSRRSGPRKSPISLTQAALVRCGAEKLTDKQKARLDRAIAADERHDEVYVAWQCAQQLRAAYTAESLVEGRRIAEKVLASFPTCPIPEIRRLGRTLKQWRQAFMAYFDTGRATNGGTEAINGLIELHRRIARGFRNRENYRLRMLLIGGGLDQPHRK